VLAAVALKVERTGSEKKGINPLPHSDAERQDFQSNKFVCLEAHNCVEILYFSNLENNKKYEFVDDFITCGDDFKDLIKRLYFH
jgi:hypothetical protein